MKNKFFTFLLFFLFLNKMLLAENVLIESRNMLFDKNKKISIFENDVVITTKDNNKIKSDYAEYDKKLGLIILKRNIIATDNENNIIETNYAEYKEKDKILKSKGPTKIITTEKYVIEGENITYDNKENFIKSNNSAIITDQEDNKIYLDNFDYQISKSIFKSIGYIKIEDKLDNLYEFSQIYIDTKKKEILGTDTKAFINNEDFKINAKNKPRIFSNTTKINNNTSTFDKSIFTLCDYRENDKCPPWSIQASKMRHDNTKKTIYYDNAVIKIYDIPVFYIPKLSHPDPNVDRRSGFLPPSFSDSKNLGEEITIPYFWAVNKDKNFTLTNKLFAKENPLFLGEYHQAFNNATLFADFGHTEGYKKTNSKKKAGDKSHFFSSFIKNFKNKNDSESSLSVSVQHVSEDKYLKLYKIDSSIVDYNTSTLENSVNFIHENDDIFLGLNASVYETLKNDYDDKYEYILPEVTLEKNLFNDEQLGNLDLQTNYKIHQYDTNKFTNFLVNDFNWSSKEINYQSGLKGQVFGNFKNINYEANNVDLYKEEANSELFGALGYLTQVDLQKNNNNTNHYLTPKILLRYSPGSMRNEINGSRLEPIGAFSINRLNNINNFETGLSSTIGFDYKLKKDKKDFDFSIAQVVNEKENKKMPTKTGLDEKLSDIVGSSKYELSDKIDLKYNFNIDQNFRELNYSEIGTSLDLNVVNIDWSYLQEDKHIGIQEYVKTKLDYTTKKNGLFSFETKRNLITNSSEFYNLSYEYFNDCLRAGIVYRREYYTDSEIEPENSLMFKVTLTPFGNVSSPSFGQ
jgi:LPS-assembly protein